MWQKEVMPQESDAEIWGFDKMTPKWSDIKKRGRAFFLGRDRLRASLMLSAGWQPLNSANGSVLVLTLLILVLLTIAGAAAIRTSTTEITIAGNHLAATSAFYAAEAGVVEAKKRLQGDAGTSDYMGDPAVGFDLWWSAYLLSSNMLQPVSDDSLYDGNYKNYIPITGSLTNTSLTLNSRQTAIEYMVRLRHKNEYDAEQIGHTVSDAKYYDGDGSTASHSAASPGSIMYYGYGDSSQPDTAVQFTTNAPTEYQPIEVVRAYGLSGDYQGQSLRVIEIEVVRNPGPPINSAIYAKGDVTGNGSSLSVDGSDNCGAVADKAPIYTKTPSITILSGSPTLSGNPATPVTGSDDIDVEGYVDEMKDSIDETIISDQSGINYGDAADFITAYADTSNPYNVNGLKLQNVTGYGILLVEGDLILGGGFNWNGLILVTGTLTFNGGGSGINIRGAVLANQTVDINGNIDVRYDSCMVTDALKVKPLKLLSWREVY